MEDASNDALRGAYVEAFMSLKRLMMALGQHRDMRMGEFMALQRIAVGGMRSGDGCISDIQSDLNVSKPAVSQMLSALERKGYLERELSALDRRRMTLTLTAEGRAALERARAYNEAFIDRVINSLGEEDSLQFVRLLKRFTSAIETIRQEATDKEKTLC